MKYLLTIKKKINKSLLDLNKKSCTRLKIYFTEQQGDIFFAELIKRSQKKDKFDDKGYFGISYMYMFKQNNQKVELI